MWRRNYKSVDMGIKEVDTVNCTDGDMGRRNYVSAYFGIKEVDTVSLRDKDEQICKFRHSEKRSRAVMQKSSYFPTM